MMQRDLSARDRETSPDPQPSRPLRGVVAWLGAVGAVTLTVGASCGLAVVVRRPVGGLVSIVITVPIVATFTFGAAMSNMRHVASRAPEAHARRRETRAELAWRVLWVALLFMAVVVPFTVWTLADDDPNGAIAGTLIGGAIGALLEARWWHRWETLYGVEMCFEPGWTRRTGLGAGTDVERCWFVRSDASRTG